MFHEIFYLYYPGLVFILFQGEKGFPGAPGIPGANGLKVKSLFSLVRFLANFLEFVCVCS